MNKHKLRRLERHKKFEEEILMEASGMKIAIDSGKRVRIEAKELKSTATKWRNLAIVSFVVAAVIGIGLVVLG